MELFADVMLDAVVDTAKLLPFLLATYLVMEALEHGAGRRIERAVARAGLAGPVIGSALGAIPQCGFSAAAATLYAGGVVSAGTLVAVILSTSDEMLPVLLAAHAPMAQMLAIVGVKALCGVLAGTLIDVANRIVHIPTHEHHIHDLCVREHCGCDDEPDEDDAPKAPAADPHGAPDHDHHDHDHGHAHGGRHVLPGIVRSALVHTVQVGGFILLVSLALGLAIELAGEQAIASVLSGSPVAAVFVAALVGLVPNCAASVAITDLYLQGALGAPAMLSGLLVSGGTGLLVLYRTNADVRENLVLTAAVYVAGVAAGIVAAAAGVTF